VSFFAQNLLLGVSTFYGTSAWHYHFSQSLPILLTTAVPFVIPEWIQCAFTKTPREGCSNPMRLLAWASLITITVFSFIPHKEWRFVHFLLPILLQFGVSRVRRQGGLTRRQGLALLGVSVIPAVYLGGFHGRSQVSVTDYLRKSAPAVGTAVLMPCHSTPWQSHIHREDLAIWFLSCEPPIGWVAAGRACAAAANNQFDFTAWPTRALTSRRNAGSTTMLWSLSTAS
jgi:phosphatidylinositol glycan class B